MNLKPCLLNTRVEMKAIDYHRLNEIEQHIEKQAFSNGIKCDVAYIAVKDVRWLIDKLRRIKDESNNTPDS